MIGPRWHHVVMADASDETAVVPADEVTDVAQRALAEPEPLAKAFRLLRDRIPGFILLSPREQRSLTRAAHLDPEFIEAGIRAGKAWEKTEQKIGCTGEELGGDADEIRRWDEVESEMRAATKGVADSNRQRRHRLGKKILQLYFFLGLALKNDAHHPLRSHYEEMQRAYMRRRKPKRTKDEE